MTLPPDTLIITIITYNYKINIMKTNYYALIQEYLQKCEERRREGKDIPKLELTYPLEEADGFVTPEQVVQALSEITQSEVKAKDIVDESIPIMTNFSFDYQPSPVLYVTFFKYQSTQGFFKIRKGNNIICFYSPLYQNSPHIVAERRSVKNIIIGTLILFILAVLFLAVERFLF